MNVTAAWIRIRHSLLFIIVMTAGCVSPPYAQPEKREVAPVAVPGVAGRNPAKASLGMAASDVAGPDILVLEVESFTLKQAQIREDKKASGGKLVLFDFISGSAETTLPLKKGVYEVTAYALAADTDKDAFYLLGPGMDVRTWPEDVWKISPAKAAKMTVKKDGPVTLKIEPAEVDVMVDRLEIRRVKDGGKAQSANGISD